MGLALRPICERHEDSQSHVLICQVILSIKPTLNYQTLYDHIDDTQEEQIKLVQEFEKYLELKDILLEEDDEYQVGLPGHYSGPVLVQAAAGGNSRDSIVQ